MPVNRIYIVKTPTSTHIVEAANPSSAVAIVTRRGVTVEPASAVQVAALMGKGLKLERADDASADSAAAQ